VELGRRCDSADRRREQQRFAAIEREKLQAEGERKALIVHAENVRAETCIDNIEIGEKRTGSASTSVPWKATLMPLPTMTSGRRPAAWLY